MTIQEIGQKVDKIVITDKDFKQVSKWAKINKLPYMLDKRYFFPLKTFVIDLQPTKQVRILALVELDDFNPTSGRIQTDQYWFTFKHLKGEGKSEIKGQGAPQNVMEVTHIWVVGVLLYICEQAREKRYRISPMTDHKENDNPYEYQDRVCFLLNDIIEYSTTHHNRKSIQYQCECWGVRGHIRHYTDGRTIFIEPYKKGRLRDTLEPKSKTYMIRSES